MKHIWSFILGMLLLIGCTPENRVIEKPAFLVSNTTSIEVSKVTLTDSTTVLDIFARYRPKYWIRIAQSSCLTDNKGNTYPILSGIGIELDKEFWMPESGEAEFQLVFPPLKSGVKSISFSEGPGVERGFSIWGIQLKGDKLPALDVPKELLTPKTDKETPLSVPELKYGEATLKGKLLDYQPGMNPSISIQVNSPLNGPGVEKVDVNEDGSFEFKTQVTGIASAVVLLSDFQSWVEVFIAPEQTSEVYLNLREMSRLQSKFHADKTPYGNKFYYSGPLETLVYELPEALQMLVSGPGTSPDFDKAPEVLLKEYKQTWMDRFKQWEETINQSDLSVSTKSYLKNHSQLRLLSALQNAPQSLASEYMYEKKIEDRNEFFAMYEKLNKACPSDYIPSELYQILNEPTTLLNQEYTEFAVAADRISKQHSLPEGQLTMMSKAFAINQGIKEFIPLTDEQKEQMKELPESIREYLNGANERLLATIEANKKKTGFTINEAGEVSNEDLFASIISKYHGKTILVDFWATWCGPCRMANKEMKPMKEELKDKDVVYLYIAGENSPKGTWENMITDIPGEHFRVTAKQWDYLCNTFGVDGVPTYLVLDREGEIKYKSVGFPGVAKMKEELLKAN